MRTGIQRRIIHQAWWIMRGRTVHAGRPKTMSRNAPRKRPARKAAPPRPALVQLDTPLALVALAAAAGLYAGWRSFWFLCDDAYIAFRYAAQSLQGLGYTWNPPPFRPVEGYTSFLWLVLLEGVWRVTGAPP